MYDHDCPKMPWTVHTTTPLTHQMTPTNNDINIPQMYDHDCPKMPSVDGAHHNTTLTHSLTPGASCKKSAPYAKFWVEVYRVSVHTPFRLK